MYKIQITIRNRNIFRKLRGSGVSSVPRELDRYLSVDVYDATFCVSDYFQNEHLLISFRDNHLKPWLNEEGISHYFSATLPNGMFIGEDDAVLAKIKFDSQYFDLYFTL